MKSQFPDNRITGAELSKSGMLPVIIVFALHPVYLLEEFVPSLT